MGCGTRTSSCLGSRVGCQPGGLVEREHGLRDEGILLLWAVGWVGGESTSSRGIQHACPAELAVGWVEREQEERDFECMLALLC